VTVTYDASDNVDAVHIEGSHQIWVDHCDLSSDRDLPKGTYDGLVDITHGSYNITVSWTYFHDHFNPCLVGHTDTPNTEDAALAVTFHHNRFQRLQSGAPRARFGVYARIARARAHEESVRTLFGDPSENLFKFAGAAHFPRKQR
jgi:pectate lyase